RLGGAQPVAAGSPVLGDRLADGAEGGAERLVAEGRLELHGVIDPIPRAVRHSRLQRHPKGVIAPSFGSRGLFVWWGAPIPRDRARSRRVFSTAARNRSAVASLACSLR